MTNAVLHQELAQAQTAAAPSSRFAGFAPAGTMAWPGRIATTITVSGCDFHCAYCHSPHLTGAGRATGVWTEFRDYLHRRRSWIDGVVVTGGEPTDDPSIVSLLETLADVNVPVRLDTNGSHPELLGRLIAEELVTSVALDVKTTFDRYESATGRADAAERVRESIRTLIDTGVDHEFRTTVYPAVITSAQVTDIARELQGGRLYALQQFESRCTLDAAAAQVVPEAANAITRAARDCSEYIPTITRGV